MTDASISYTVEEHVGVLTIDRPPVNAVRFEDVEALTEFLENRPAEDELAMVLTTGGEKAFMAGHDVNEFLDSDPKTEAAGTETYMRFLDVLYEFPIPTVVAVDGPALGTGAAVAATCDIRVTSPSATFGLPEINVGLVGGYRPVSRVLPADVARYLAFTGETITGERAYQLGMASVLAEDPFEAALETARTIAAKSPDAVKAAKRIAVETQPRWPVDEFRKERTETEQLVQGHNAREAASAFLEKRSPDFTY